MRRSLHQIGEMPPLGFTLAAPEPGAPITEREELEQVDAMGLHGLAFDDVHEDDEVLPWHEFEGVTWVTSGTGSFADEHGDVTHVQPGCRLRAPAGWLHRSLAGTRTRVVIETNLPGEAWTRPMNKDPADRPAALSAWDAERRDRGCVSSWPWRRVRRRSGAGRRVRGSRDGR